MNGNSANKDVRRQADGKQQEDDLESQRPVDGKVKLLNGPERLIDKDKQADGIGEPDRQRDSNGIHLDRCSLNDRTGAVQLNGKLQKGQTAPLDGRLNIELDQA